MTYLSGFFSWTGYETITFEQIKQDIRSNVAHPCYSAFEKEMGYRLEEIHDNYYKISYDIITKI